MNKTLIRVLAIALILFYVAGLVCMFLKLTTIGGILWFLFLASGLIMYYFKREAKRRAEEEAEEDKKCE